MRVGLNLRVSLIVGGLVAFARGEPGEKWTEDVNRVLERARDLTAACAAQHRATVELELTLAAVPIRASPRVLVERLDFSRRFALLTQRRARRRAILVEPARSSRHRVPGDPDDSRGTPGIKTAGRDEHSLSSRPLQAASASSLQE